MRDVQSLKNRLYFMAALYFMWWANLSFKRWQPTVIAITGSVGKTTMLHLTETQLGQSAHYSHNANSAFGLAFDMVGLSGITGSRLRWFWLLIAVPIRSFFFTHSKDYYVVEIDGERPGEASRIAAWLKPHVTLWVSLTNSHAVYYDNEVASGKFATIMDAIADEFATIPRATQDLVLYDGTNSLMQNALTDIKAKTIALDGQTDNYQVTSRQTKYNIAGQEFDIPYALPRDLAIQLEMLVQLMIYLKLPLDPKLPGLTMAPGRNSTFAGIKETTLIDSS